jgi:hypothetical protein
MCALICAFAALTGWTVCEPFFAEGGSSELIGAGNTFMGPFVIGAIVAAFILIYRRSDLTYVDTALSIFLLCRQVGDYPGPFFLLELP